MQRMRRRACDAGSIGQTSPPGWSTGDAPAPAPPAGALHAACSSAGASGCCAVRAG